MSIALVERGRRAVYHALNLVLSDRVTVLRAYRLLEQRFEHGEEFRVTLYVTMLAKAQLLEPSEVRGLSGALYSALAMPAEELPQLPAVLRSSKVARPRNATAPPAKQQPATHLHLAIFESLMAALVESVRDLQRLDAFLAALEAQQPVLSRATLRARAAWIGCSLAALPQFAAMVPQAERRAVLNDLYLALCQACGRADADDVLAVAVFATEQVGAPA